MISYSLNILRTSISTLTSAVAELAGIELVDDVDNVLYDDSGNYLVAPE
jgi:hypothetical protein